MFESPEIHDLAAISSAHQYNTDCCIYLTRPQSTASEMTTEASAKPCDIYAC